MTDLITGFLGGDTNAMGAIFVLGLPFAVIFGCISWAKDKLSK